MRDMGEQTVEERQKTSPGEGDRGNRPGGSAAKKERYHLLDGIRGFTLVNMVIFHTLYDLVFVFGVKMGWFAGRPGYIWQQYICYSFILLAGMSWSLSRSNFRRGLLVFLLGFVLTAATYFLMPSQTVRFGVLSLLGASMLLFIPLNPLLLKMKPVPGMASSLFFFFLARGVPQGYLGYEGIRLFVLPRGLYTHRWLSFLGFPTPDFVSSDYFPLIPWIFLFGAGYFLMRILREGEGKRARGALMLRLPVFEALGRHTLFIYMLHQPLIMLILTLGFGTGNE